MTAHVAALGSRQNLAAILTALVSQGAGLSGLTTTGAGDLSPVTIAPCEERRICRPSLIGSYVVTGVSVADKPSNSGGILDISMTPSGAVELDWDNGKILAIVQVIKNLLAVTCVTMGCIPLTLITEINSDGSLSGKWRRR
jgi:hypothetical protein